MLSQSMDEPSYFVFCGECRSQLPRFQGPSAGPDAPPQPPCPNCGSTARTFPFNTVPADDPEKPPTQYIYAEPHVVPVTLFPPTITLERVDPVLGRATRLRKQ